MILIGLGCLIATAMFLVVWPWRPFEWIKPMAAVWSCLSGVLSSFGTCQYVIFADEGIPADIAGPATGLHFLVPPL